MIGWDDATLITGLLGVFFVVLALIALARSVVRQQNLPAKHRYRFGVFMEHDHNVAPDDDDQEEELP